MRKGGGGKCPPIVFLEGANIHHYAFVEGAHVLPCQLLGGQISTHAIFHRGADVRGGKCPAPDEPNYFLLKFDIKTKGHHSICKRGRPKSIIFTLKSVPWMEFVQ